MEDPENYFTPPATVRGGEWKVKSGEQSSKVDKAKGGGEKDPNESVDLTADEGDSETSEVGKSADKEKKVKKGRPETVEERKARGIMEKEMLSKQGTTRLFKTPPAGRSHSTSRATPKPVKEGVREDGVTTTPGGTATPGTGKSVKKKRSVSSPAEESSKKPKRADEGEETDLATDVEDELELERSLNSDLQREFLKLSNSLIHLSGKARITQAGDRRLRDRIQRVGKMIIELEQAAANSRPTEGEVETTAPQIVEERSCKKMLDADTQTPASWNSAEEECEEDIASRLKEEIREKNSLEHFLTMVDTKWPRKMFERVKTGTDDIMSIAWDWDMAVTIPKDFCMDEGVERQFLDRFQGIEELQEQEAEVGGLAHLANVRKIPGKAQGSGITEFKETTRHVYYMVTADRRSDPQYVGHLFESALKLKAFMVEQSRRKVAVATGDKINIDAIRKVYGYVFADTEVEVLLLRALRGGKASKKQKVPPPLGRFRNEEALIIRPEEGKTYADLLARMRGEVDLEKTGAFITKIRKTREGDLLLGVRKAEGGLEALKNEVQERFQGAKITALAEKGVMIRLNGLDGVTTVEEVVEAITSALTHKPERVLKVEMWPAFGGRQNASIMLSKMEAGELLKLERIKIGWLSCQIREHREVEKCFRCWNVGHTRAQCKGQDRSRLCHRCGKEGHIAKECEGEAYCPICEVTGHRACTTGCQVFRKELGMTGTRSKRAEGPGGVRIK